MKKLLLLVIFISSVSFAQEEVSFPNDNPLFSISVPYGWSSQIYYEDTLLEIVTNDEVLFYSIYALDTNDFLEAVQKIWDAAEFEFEEPDMGARVEEETNGILFHTFSGSGVTEDYDYYFFYARLFQIDDSNYFMIFYSGLPDDLDDYDFDLYELNYSIKKK